MSPEQQLPRVEIFGRAAMPGTHDRQQAVLEQLDRLVAEEYIEDYTVTTWEGRVRIRPEGSRTSFPAEQFREFQRWANRNDVSLEPFFDRTEHESSFTGEEFVDLVFPVLCLAVVRGDDLETVAPHRDDGANYGVEDCLDDLTATPAAERQVAVRDRQ